MRGQMNHFIVKFSPNRAMGREVCSLGCFILYSQYYIADVILVLVLCAFKVVSPQSLKIFTKSNVEKGAV